MKRVILIGDSIRMGYQATVRQDLAGWADVWAAEANGGPSRRVVATLDEALARKPGIVHVNCGLHDLARDRDAKGESRVPLAEYEANVRHVLTRLRDGGATVIWATITPVNQERHRKAKSFDRLEADVTTYNEAALRVARSLGVVVDDLFAVVMAGGRDALLRADGVHFTPEGYELLGHAVAQAIRAAAQPFSHPASPSNSGVDR